MIPRSAIPVWFTSWGFGICRGAVSSYLCMFFSPSFTSNYYRKSISLELQIFLVEYPCITYKKPHPLKKNTDHSSCRFLACNVCTVSWFFWVDYTSNITDKVLLRESIVFWGKRVLSILVDVFIVNLFSIFLFDSAARAFYWNSLASRKAVALASFFRLSTLLFLQPSIVVYEVAEPMLISLFL